METKKEGTQAPGSAIAETSPQTNSKILPDVCASAKQPKIVMRAINTLKPYENNARVHSPKQIRQLAKSLKQFGCKVPVLADADGVVVAGHARLEAAKLLGMDTVPTIVCDDLTPDEIKAYRIADNRIAELAEWDQGLLAMEFEYLIEHDFDVEVTGFETAEIDLLIGDAATEPDEADDLDGVVVGGPVISRPGDLWLLGPNRLICGDALDGKTYSTLMDGKLAQMGFLDVPYNLSISKDIFGQHSDFVMASGEMSETEFIEFLEISLGHCATHSIDGAIHFICMDWRHIYELQTAARKVYTTLKNLCVWDKGNGGMGSFYRSQHELIFVYKNGTAPHINNFGLGETGRYRTNLWKYIGMNSFGPERDEALAFHPTSKPVAMVADAIRDCSKRGGIILDAFAGSGTTIIAAERTGRICNAIELDNFFVDVAIRRWQTFTGETARLANTGQSFAEVEAEREPPVVQHPSETPHVG